MPSSLPTRGNLDTFAKGRAEGATKGAMMGGTYGALEGLSAGAGGGPYALAAATIAVAVMFIVGATTGGVVGQQAAISADVAERIDSQVDGALRAADLNGKLAAALREQAAVHPEARAHGLDRLDVIGDTQLELQVTEAGFVGGQGADPALLFYMNARAQVQGSDGTPLYQRDFSYASAPQRWSTWSASDAAELARAFGTAVDTLSGRILDELFVVTSFPFPSGFWAFPGTPEYGSCWLRPLDPPHKIRGFSFHFNPYDMIKYLHVQGLQPTLKWEAFPRPRDELPENEALLARITDVTYDLKIWEASGGFPQRLVDDRSGLTKPEYRVERPLDPDRDYFWTFRARYRLDGAPQATRWAFSLVPAPPGGMNGSGGYCDLDNIPPSNYYRFTTRN